MLQYVNTVLVGKQSFAGTDINAAAVGDIVVVDQNDKLVTTLTNNIHH